MLTNEQKTLLESKTAQYQANAHLADEYLEGRGFTADTIDSARLGVVDGPIEGDPHAAGQRLSIPYITQSGVVNLRFRCIRGHDCGEASCPKYLGSSGVPSRLYGARCLLSAGSRICITEGELDALTLHQLGYPAVGVPGATSWKRHWRRLFEDFSKVYVICDGDAAGWGFRTHILAEIPTAQAVMLPDHQDTNSMYVKEGGGYFAELLR
jgi:DNA primase